MEAQLRAEPADTAVQQLAHALQERLSAATGNSITVPSLHHHGTITVPSLHHHCTITGNLSGLWKLRSPMMGTITAPSLHHHCTITSPGKMVSAMFTGLGGGGAAHNRCQLSFLPSLPVDKVGLTPHHCTVPVDRHQQYRINEPSPATVILISSL